ncbi:hypothetical protein MCOR14_006571 [Pyricularia oryzae]|nr:hypothetical protein MCOR30_001818 [Pyricularia oryzae]KAI6430932.1 hypothetical protein MCOR24_001737 [Pyricularia oryzae]KAI6444566.1 hypothetical protein MCOR22_004783 [Pyricularia oryzae]KAI6498699.1 hypothetical protein MCOR11_003821 [Pyricularia oryzae]KAI6633715.1 hypothetical protein MCOR14_006571 [Pyricularia oryzae]
MAPNIDRSKPGTAGARAADIDPIVNAAATMTEGEREVPAQVKATKDNHILKSICFQLDHVFLPPTTETPAGNPSTFTRDDLLHQVSICLEAFHNADSLPELKASIKMIDQMRQMYHGEGALDADVAIKNIRSLRHDSLAFHIRAQNAGLLLRRDGNVVIFESFELTPRRTDTVACKGHLVRTFPNIAIALDASIVTDDSFCKPFASLLSGLDIEPHPDNVGRESADPKMVTRMITGILGGSGGTKKEVRKIIKRTREEATMQGAEVWERSALWLFLRVSLQLTLDGLNPNREPSLYKSVMVYCMTQMLERALDHATEIPPYLIYCARCKIDRRIRKLKPPAGQFWLSPVFKVLKRAQELQDQQWSEIQQKEKPELAERSNIGVFDISDAKVLAGVSLHSLNTLNKYIVSGRQRPSGTASKVKASSEASANHEATVFLRLKSSLSQLPAVQVRPMNRGGIYDLAEVEAWVGTHLSQWTQTNIGKQSACDRICAFFDKYHKHAKHLYLGNPELESLMHLVMLELWVACDTIATSEFTFLSEHGIQLPAEVTSTLILPTRELLMRANTVEQYIADRKRQAKEGLTPFFGSCGNSDSFAVRFYDDSMKELSRFFARGKKLGLIRKNHDDEFAEAQRSQQEKLESMAKEYGDLKRLAAAPHKRQGAPNDWGHEDKAACDKACATCAHETMAESLSIEVVEHALPADENKVKSILFWAQAPAILVRWADLYISLFVDVLGAGQSAPVLPEVSYGELTDDGKSVSENEEYPGEDNQEDKRVRWLLASKFRPYAQHTVAVSKKSRLQLRSPRKCLKDFRKNVSIHISKLVNNDYKPIHGAINHICVMNGRQYEYFDRKSAVWTSAYTKATPKLPPMLSYARLSHMKELQPFISQWTHSSNEIIARQSNCPLKMGHRAFKAFGHLRAGIRVQLTNLLATLCESTLPIGNDETAYLFLQAVYEAGPMSDSSKMDQKKQGQVSMPPVEKKKEDGVASGSNNPKPDKPSFDSASSVAQYREAHHILIDESFAHELSTALQDCVERLKGSGEQSTAIFTLASLTARLLSLSDSETVQGQCLGALSQLRDIAKKAWLELDAKEANITAEGLQGGESAQSALRDRVFAMLLACNATFDIGHEALEDLLQAPEALETFIHCSAGIRQYLTKKLSTRRLKQLQVKRWERLSYRSLGLVLQAAEKHPDVLSKVVSYVYPGFQEFGTWRPKTEPGKAHILQISDLAGPSSKKLATLSFNLLSGEVFLDAQPLTFLPPDIVAHRNYKRLLGSWDARVGPSERRDFTHATSSTYFGYILHFSLMNAASKETPNLRILAVRENNGPCFEYIPPDQLEDALPSNFIDAHFHWYNPQAAVLEFRPEAHRWTSAIGLWRAERQAKNDKWKVSQETQLLLNPRKSPLDVLVQQVTKIACGSKVCITLDTTTNMISIFVPSLGLSFEFDATASRLYSKEFKGMYIDPDQSLGTLLGFQQKLVLCSASSSDRGFIVPVGEVHQLSESSEPTAHSRIMIRKFCDDRLLQKRLFYTIDEMKGEIVDDGSHIGKIVLSLLHATTSHFLPDPLTGYTGTEQALRILRSAAMASSQALTAQEVGLLEDIARLSPIRTYISEKIKNPGFQMVTFTPGYQPLAQHDWFAPEVVKILKLDAVRKALGSDAELPNEDTFGDTTRNEDLVIRANGRLAIFRLDGFGGSIDSKFDKRYKSRGEWLTQGGCDLEKEVHATTECILQKREGYLLHYKPAEAQLLRSLYLVVGHEVDGLSSNPWPADLKFNPKWLHPPGESLGRSFCHIHDVLSSGNKNFSDYHVIIFISALIFAQNPIPEFTQVVRSFFTSEKLRNLKPPPHSLFHKLQDQPSEFLGEARKMIVTEDKMDPAISLSRPQWRSKISRLKVPFAEVLFQDAVMNPTIAEPHKWKGFIKVAESLQATLELRAEWRGKMEFHSYLDKIVSIMHTFKVERNLTGQAFDFSHRQAHTRAPLPPKRSQKLQLFKGSPPLLEVLVPSTFQLEAVVDAPEGSQQRSVDTSVQWGELLSELNKKVQRRTRGVEQLYVAGFKKSHDALKKVESDIALPSKHYRLPEDWKAELTRYRSACLEKVESIERTIFNALGHSNKLAKTDDAPSSIALPRLDRKFLLEQLSNCHWRSITDNGWKQCIISHAKAITNLQRAERMLVLAEGDNLLELKREMDNPGHTNWDAMNHPEWLLLEVESNLLIRPVQITIANEMAVERSNPGNTVLQLNMGEGKSFVIIPIVAAKLADGIKLIRVIVPKEQSVQTRQILTSKLGGLLNRRVEYLPISRAMKMTHQKAEFIKKLLASCAEQGSVLLVQPEELLSLRLLTIEMSQQNLEADTDGSEARIVLSDVQDYMHSRARDIIDESDQVLRPSYELIYTMGAAAPVELSPDRWLYHQQVLTALAEEAEATSEGASQRICVFYKGHSHFPSVRLLDDKQGGWFIGNVAKRAIGNGITNFSLPEDRYLRDQGIFELIEKENLNVEEADEILAIDPDFFHAGTKKLLALLRGLIAGGVLQQVLLKRYRIDYGLDYSRRPATRLAVPYKAKDQPKSRSQFGHPDIIILLTCLSYYQCGLTDQQMAETFNRLTELDHPDVELARWIKTSKIPPEFQKLSSINPRDTTLCRDKIYPALRFSKPVIDFFLAQIVFPQELIEFPNKISASAWDLAESKAHVTTGFSGTCDSRFQLPLEIQHKDLPEQEHTNALVIDYLLRSENRVVQLEPDDTSSKDVSSLALLRAIVKSQEPIQVLLDVGVVISDLSNFEVAKAWLDMMSTSANESLRKEACIFYSDKHDAMVLDLSGKVDFLSRSPYSTQTDRCLAYFDELHTRGIDLRLPDHYRAATTLGPGLTKDKLVQACMRMRKLGTGQSISFFVTPEVQSLIMASKGSRKATEISIADIICWSITETWKEMYRNVGNWQQQGVAHQRHKEIWKRMKTAGKNLSREANQYTQSELRSLESRYMPRDGLRVRDILKKELEDPLLAGRKRQLEQMRQKIIQISVRDVSASLDDIDEEQEREIDKQVEIERDIDKPKELKARKGRIHKDLKYLILHGAFNALSPAFLPAFETLKTTTAGERFDFKQFGGALMATNDFATTIILHPKSCSDMYHRPVRYVLSIAKGNPASDSVIIIISPFEANELWHEIRNSKHVHLHVYTARLSEEFRSMDRLANYATPPLPDDWRAPSHLLRQLNLFAGQLYFANIQEYRSMCRYLGLACTSEQFSNKGVSSDGFGGKVLYPECSFDTSPLPLLRVLLSNVRMDSQGIRHTHMGKMLFGEILEEKDFKEEDSLFV